MADLIAGRGERGGPFQEGGFLAEAFVMARVAGDGEGAVGSEELKPFLDAVERRVCLGSDRFVAAWQVAEIVDNQARGIGEGNLVDVGMGEAVEDGFWGMDVCFGNRLRLDVEADCVAELCQK